MGCRLGWWRRMMIRGICRSRIADRIGVITVGVMSLRMGMGIMMRLVVWIMDMGMGMGIRIMVIITMWVRRRLTRFPLPLGITAPRATVMEGITLTPGITICRSRRVTIPGRIGD